VDGEVFIFFMKKNQFVLLQLASIFVFLVCPSLAAESISNDAETPTNASELSSKSDGVANKQAQTVVKKATLSKKIFGITTAFFIGTPVCVVRRSKYEEWYGVHGMIGDSESKTKKILAGAFWLPFAVVTGTAEAPFDAAANALMYPAFSKDQQSKGKLVQNN